MLAHGESSGERGEGQSSLRIALISPQSGIKVISCWAQIGAQEGSIRVREEDGGLKDVHGRTQDGMG